MKADEINVGDVVYIIRGDWAGQSGQVINKCDLLPVSSSDGVLPSALLTIRLSSAFNKNIQKRNSDVEQLTAAS